jgi:hypothetical protein
MARTDLRTKIRLEGDATGADKAIKKTEKGFKRLGTAIKENAAKIAAFVAAAVGLARTFTSLAKAAFETESAVRKVEAAMKAAGDFSEIASSDMQKFAKNLQNVGTVSDESVLQMVALAKGFVGTNAAAQELVATAVDFKEAASISFEEAVRRIGRATQGSVEDISKFDTRILKLTKTQLENGDATKLLGEKYEGLNKAMADTAEGGILQMENAIQDLKSAFAGGFLETAQFSDGVQDLTGRLQGGEAAADRMGTVIALMAKNLLQGQGTFEAGAKALLELGSVTDKAADSTDAEAEAAKKAAAELKKKTEAERAAAIATKQHDEAVKKLNEALVANVDAYNDTINSASAFGEVTSVQLANQISEISLALIVQTDHLDKNGEEYIRLERIAAAKIDSLKERIENLRQGLGDLNTDTTKAKDSVGAYGEEASNTARNVDALTQANGRLVASTRAVSAAAGTPFGNTSVWGPSQYGGGNLRTTPFNIRGGTFTTVAPVSALPNGRLS